MAAGLGFKDFTTGEVLTAADVDGYLMQGIWVFASAAARDAAVTSPQEGNACYLKDTNQVLTYSGSAWVAVGGGSPLTTKGDLYTFSTVDARLGVGANGTTLVADSAQATGLKWAAPGAASFVGCYLSKSANQSIANNTTTSITFNTEQFDTDGFHSTVTNTERITIPVGKAGKYLIIGQLAYASNSTGNRYISLNKNGTIDFGRVNVAAFNGDLTWVIASIVLNLAEGDYVYINADQNSGGSLNAYGADINVTTFSATFLGA